MRMRFFVLLIIVFALFVPPGSALAQDYYFQIPKLDVNAYWNEDGTLSIDYVYEFINDPSGHAIEYVDVGTPNSNFSENNVSADVNGNPLSYISKSEFQGTGNDGVAIGLQSHSIPPGGRGTFHVFIGGISDVLYVDSDDNQYASAVLKPTFYPDTSYGRTDLTVTFHLPPGVQPDEPRWHPAPNGFPDQPETGIDDQGRIYYRWHNPDASPTTQYEFGASFPKTYVPESAITSLPGFLSQIDTEAIFPCICFTGILLIILASVFASRNRKLQYLPPKITIEGHGIKRGLTAVEAAILLEQPLDKILTMILFSVIKKNTAKVTKKDPLELEVIEPLPADLNQYEVDFLHAFQKDASTRRKALQDTIIDLVKSVSTKMKGFSRKETIAYYQDIIDKAWKQVEAAETPEVKSESYDKVMEWTMLDKNYDDRTRDVFRTGPVFIPTWWGRFDPTYTGPSAPSTVSTPSLGKPSGGGVSMPQLPGSSFAGSIVGGVQNFATSVVGNITEFTGRIAQQTNPAPKPTTTTWSGGRGGGTSGGGHSCVCACACACAGCACACAGGGR